MIRKCMRIVLLVILFVPLVACTTGERTELPSVSLVVSNGIVVDGTGTDPITDGLVAIDGNRIVAVGRSADFTISEEATVIDAEGGTILPGVINSHAHKVATAATRRHLFLLDGVTSVCDLGDLLVRMQQFEQEEIQSGPAARGFKAGSFVTAPGGYPGIILGNTVNYEIQGEDEAEIAVRDLHTRGADFIKVTLEPGIPGMFGESLPVLNLQEMSSIVTTAHANDLLVRAHVNNAMLDIALETGVDVIEHVPMPSYSLENMYSMFGDAGDFRVPPELETQILRMIEQEIVLVPTLDIMTNETFLRRELGIEPEAFIQGVLGVVRFFHDSGGTIAVGNDYGNPGVEPGMPLREMELLESAGLSPMEVIEAATRHAAYVCGHGGELGTLETGKLADLIVVDGNPLEDLDVMDSVLYVVKDGEVVVSPQHGSQ